jgi:predicted enzyme related to lactoylglutathione lyase
MRESFYTKVFGWDFSPFQGPEDFWPIATDLDGKTEDPEAAARSLHQAIAVVSLEEATQKILNQGGKILAPPVIVAGTGYLLYCQDATGNSFAILEADNGAAFEEKLED